MPNKKYGYCMKCREEVQIKNGIKTFMKNGRAAVKGVCSTCQTTVYRIVSHSNTKSTKL